MCIFHPKITKIGIHLVLKKFQTCDWLSISLLFYCRCEIMFIFCSCGIKILYYTCVTYIILWTLFWLHRGSGCALYEFIFHRRLPPNLQNLGSLTWELLKILFSIYLPFDKFCIPFSPNDTLYCTRTGTAAVVLKKCTAWWINAEYITHLWYPTYVHLRQTGYDLTRFSNLVAL
jgi:hypothetical protein